MFSFSASADFDCVVARRCVNIETTNPFSFWISKYQQQLNNMNNVIVISSWTCCPDMTSFSLQCQIIYLFIKKTLFHTEIKNYKSFFVFSPYLKLFFVWEVFFKLFLSRDISKCCIFPAWPKDFRLEKLLVSLADSSCFGGL